MAKLVQDYVAQSVKKFPSKPALVINGQSITYAGLDKKSTQLANFLKEKGVRQGDRVCLYLPKSINSFISIIAILKADAIYVPINISTPEARFMQIVPDSGSRFVIVNERKSLLPDISAVGEYINFNTEKDIFIEERNNPINYANDESDTAYILYTSGSTGVPKGVMITHGNIINATDWAVDEFGINENDRMSQPPPLNFDLSTFDIYTAFKSGATLYPVSEELSLFPGTLLKFIEENELTIWNSVPSVLVYLWNSGLVKPDRLKPVRKIFFNGEGFPTKFLAEWMKIFPEKEFVNMYGPTETTVQCTFYRISEPPQDLTKLVPIGKACRNVEVFDIDGELYVGGQGVGAGYWNNPEKTAASFVADPRPGKRGTVYKTGDLVRLRADGNYEFLGRKDNQVKIRGNRIELGDVDAALYSLPYINEAAVIAVADSQSGGNKLVAFVDLKKFDEIDIKKDLERLIPPYMIPDEVRVLQLPKTSTGKIDRPKLKEMYGNKK